jgi:DNA (cytosine-5)-methyltransferase 1
LEGVGVVYYNENDPRAAAWLRELIREGAIAEGKVDDRSIVDVRPGDLDGFAQCHFFAGIGGWSYALRLAGWQDDREVWTGSCPCQPFSVAGARRGTADERHLWPAWRPLIEERRPAAIFGEQVDSPDGVDWLDAVLADLERADYAVAPVGLCAAGFGAPHGRARLWFVADRVGVATRDGHGAAPSVSGCLAEAYGGRLRVNRSAAGARGALSELYVDERERPRLVADAGREQPRRPDAGSGEGARQGDGRSSDESRRPGSTSALGDADGAGREARDAIRSGDESRSAEPAHPGYWSDADWIWCRDEKWRPVEPGTFPLADGISARVGRLRGYGNAIVPQVAAALIRAYIDVGRIS